MRVSVSVLTASRSDSYRRHSAQARPPFRSRGGGSRAAFGGVEGESLVVDSPELGGGVWGIVMIRKGGCGGAECKIKQSFMRNIAAMIMSALSGHPRTKFNTAPAR